jgi:hypothetical protein
MELRDATPADAPAILELNRESEWAMTPLDVSGFDSLYSMASAVLVAVDDEEVLAFALALPTKSAYDSANYRWFGERYDSFLYLDRIAVAERFRRRGAGRALYDEMERRAAPHGRMLCEVNFVPPNETSLAFHKARGYDEVGTLAHPTGKVVVMLAKELGAG